MRCFLAFPLCAMHVPKCFVAIPGYLSHSSEGCEDVFCEAEGAVSRRCRLRSGFSAVLMASRKMSTNHSKLYWYMGSTSTHPSHVCRVNIYMELCAPLILFAPICRPCLRGQPCEFDAHTDSKLEALALHRSATTKNMAELRMETGTSGNLPKNRVLHRLKNQASQPKWVECANIRSQGRCGKWAFLGFLFRAYQPIFRTRRIGLASLLNQCLRFLLLLDPFLDSSVRTQLLFPWAPPRKKEKKKRSGFAGRPRQPRMSSIQRRGR